FKRHMFLPGFHYHDLTQKSQKRLARLQPSWDRFAPPWNVYQAETDLFQSLGRDKRRERPIDRLISLAVYIALLGLLLTLVCFCVFRHHLIIGVLEFGFFGTLLISAIVGQWRRALRRPRAYT